MSDSFEKKYNSYYRINSSTLEEICEEHTPGFAFFAAECDPTTFAGYTYPWHWHSYVQFFYVTKGKICYETEERKHYFEEGECGFININIPHKLYALSGRDTRYREYLFYPSFIGGELQGDISRRYVHDVTENAAVKCISWNKYSHYNSVCANLLKDIYDVFEKKEDCYELEILAKVSLLWSVLYKSSRKQRESTRRDHTSGRIKAMLLYINEHYREKITLDDIAAAGACSRRECSRTFRNDLHTTPFQYLQEVRISSASNLLINTNISITEISETCGFSDPSHFTKAFKAKSGMSPKQFRERTL